jgi:hypothetical protein
MCLSLGHRKLFISLLHLLDWLSLTYIHYLLLVLSVGNYKLFTGSKVLFVCFVLVVLGSELWASHLLGRCSYCLSHSAALPLKEGKKKKSHHQRVWINEWIAGRLNQEKRKSEHKNGEEIMTIPRFFRNHQWMHKFNFPFNVFSAAMVPNLREDGNFSIYISLM